MDPAWSLFRDRHDGRRRRIFSLLVFAGLFCSPLLTTGQTLEEFQIQVGTLLAEHRYEEALHFGRLGLERYPKDTGLGIAVALLWSRQGRHVQGARLLEAIEAERVADPVLLSLLADIHLMRGEQISAVALLRRAASLSSAPEIEYRLARLLYLVGEQEEALERAAHLVEEGEAIPVRYRKFFSSLLEQRGEFDRAGGELRAALLGAPDNARLLLRLADREQLAGRWTRALEYLDMAASADPENPLYRREIAQVYREMGASEPAKSADMAAERLESAFEALARALALENEGRREEASQLLEEAVVENPDFRSGRAFLADLYFRMGRSEEALSLYRTLEASGKGDYARDQAAWLAYLARGEVTTEFSDHPEEVSDDRLLLESYRLQNEGKWQEALDRLQRVARRYPLQMDLLKQISFCLHRAGDRSAAMKYLEKAYSVDPNARGIREQAHEIRFHHALDLQKRGEWERALLNLDQLLAEEPRSDYWFHRGYTLQKLNRHSEAAESFETGLGLAPEVAWARINLAFCYYALSLFDEAARQWEFLVKVEEKPEYVYQLGMSRIRQWRQVEGWRLIEAAARQGYEPARKMLSKRRGAEEKVSLNRNPN